MTDTKQVAVRADQSRRPFAAYLEDVGGDYDAARKVWIRDVVAEAPPLSEESLAKVAYLLQNIGDGRDASA